jgi:hypothetical protein
MNDLSADVDPANSKSADKKPRRPSYYNKHKRSGLTEAMQEELVKRMANYTQLEWALQHRYQFDPSRGAVIATDTAKSRSVNAYSICRYLTP